MTRQLLYPLVPLYAAAIAAKNSAYDRGWIIAHTLQWPVISIGNISVGGSGKTPFVICLAKLLMQHGVSVDVLSRGYSRNSDKVEQVDAGSGVERFGDEPLLIAQAANVPVYVGASRYEAGLLGEKSRPGPCVHLLDDGFQHRQLARDLDIVLMHHSDFTEALLPAGNLREPVSAIRRASVVILREDDAEMEAQLRQGGIETPIWLIRRTVNVPQAGKAVAFCGIARSEEFFSSSRARGAEVVATRAFSDHHQYSDADIQELIQVAGSNKAESFLTTEKDFVRLSQNQRDRLSTAAFLKIVKLETYLLDEVAALRLLQPHISSHPV